MGLGREAEEAWYAAGCPSSDEIEEEPAMLDPQDGTNEGYDRPRPVRTPSYDEALAAAEEAGRKAAREMYERQFAKEANRGLHYGIGRGGRIIWGPPQGVIEGDWATLLGQGEWWLSAEGLRRIDRMTAKHALNAAAAIMRRSSELYFEVLDESSVTEARVIRWMQEQPLFRALIARSLHG